MRVFRWLSVGIGILLALLIILLLAYVLPATEKVRITGTEVKRMDIEGASGSQTRDVRYIVTQSLEDGETIVYRNEDTRWGFPFYFKFNSGDLMGRAVNFQGEQGEAVVLVTSYGWRVNVMDMYPNVLSIELKPKNYTHVPVFNIVVIALLMGLLLYLYFQLRRLRSWWQARRSRTPTTPGSRSTHS
ncbi:MAG: DUF1523 family protein [Myxococcota bacterium]